MFQHFEESAMDSINQHVSRENLVDDAAVDTSLKTEY